jgi:hypothetical protein
MYSFINPNAPYKILVNVIKLLQDEFFCPALFCIKTALPRLGQDEITITDESRAEYLMMLDACAVTHRGREKQMTIAL